MLHLQGKKDIFFEGLVFYGHNLWIQPLKAPQDQAFSYFSGSFKLLAMAAKQTFFKVLIIMGWMNC